MNFSRTKSDVLIIGAGPSGSVSASYLRNKGYSISIIEKASFPRFAIGESLLPISMEHFEEAGLLEALKKAEFNIKEGAVFRREDHTFHIKFDENFTKGWTWTWQVPREDFDKILADETAKKGVDIQYNSEIEKIESTDYGFLVFLKCGEDRKEIETRFIIDASGKAVISALNGEDLKQEKTNRRALFTRMKESGDTLTSDPKLIYFDVLNKDLWFWVIPFSTNETSIGFVGDSSFFTSPDEKRNLTINEMLELSPFFKERFKKAEPLLDDIESVEYTNSTENIFGKNYVLIGNSMGFQDPVFSSGVAIATSSAIKASSLVDRELKGEKVDWSEDYQEWIDQGSKVFKTYIDYWYDGTLQAIFFCDNIQEITKRQITSVLAGYVWDQSNPFVKNPERLLKTLQKVIDIEFRKNDLKGQ